MSNAKIKIRNYFDTQLGGDWGQEKPTDVFTEKVLCVRGADLNSLKLGNTSSIPYRYINVNNKNNAPIYHLIKFNSNAIKFLISFVNTLILPYQSMFSILGFGLFISIILQILSGFFLG